MTRTRKLALVPAFALATAPLLVSGAVPPANAQPLVLTAVAAANAELAAVEFVDAIETAYKDAYLNADVPTATEVTDDALAELPVDGQGEVAVASEVDAIVEEAVAVTEDPTVGEPLTIDAVEVEQVGAPQVEMIDADTVSTTVDVMISRHIEEDDVDWVEVIPHEIIVDAATGEVQDLVVQDLEYQLEQQAADVEEPQRLMQIPEADQGPSTQPAGLSTANRQKIADYALKYATKPNKSYKYWDGADCTNFVSQAAYAGGWKQVEDGLISYKSDKSWWYGGIPTASWTWTGAENFYRMTKALKRTTTPEYVLNLRVGDFLQYKNKGASAMTHSMVVTNKSGTNLYLSYHTSNTRNKPYSAISGLKVTWYGHWV
jgi:hypothetical protein